MSWHRFCKTAWGTVLATILGAVTFGVTDVAAQKGGGGGGGNTGGGTIYFVSSGLDPKSE